MKKYTIIFIVLAITLSVALLFIYNRDTRYALMHEKVGKKYSTVQTLVKDSDIILIGKKKEDNENEKFNNFDGASISNIEIESVLQNDKGYPLYLDESIKVLENGSLHKKTNTMFGINGYELMKNKERYLLFLRKSTTENDVYTLVGVYEGKVPLDTDLKKDIQFRGNKAEKKSLLTLFQEAKETYKLNKNIKK